MSNTNVNSSNMTMTFVICGVDKKLNLKKAGKAQLGSEFKAEIKTYANTEKDLAKERRTIPISCEKKIAKRTRTENVR